MVVPGMDYFRSVTDGESEAIAMRGQMMAMQQMQAKGVERA